MKAVIRFDPTCDLHRPAGDKGPLQRACFQVQVGNQWTAPLTPYELEQYCLKGHIKEHGPAERSIDPATALITSSFFNFKKGESRAPGEAAVPAEPSATANYNPSGVVKKYHPSVEALKGMGYKSLKAYLKAKKMLPPDEDKEPRKVSAVTEARRKAIADLDLDLSGLDL